jgi:hypothetical protein
MVIQALDGTIRADGRPRFGASPAVSHDRAGHILQRKSRKLQLGDSVVPCRGRVGSIFLTQPCRPETGLRGWACRTRTGESVRELPPPVPSVPQVLPLHDAEAWPSDCALRLTEIARFAPQPTLNGPDQCGAADLVRLEKVIVPNIIPRHASSKYSMMLKDCPDSPRSSVFA